ncbi:MAG: hypothetical protein sGL2_03160 [Candidatus Mesenet longicola]|nr:MAG: hypothetical protein sGL2_03160 [Candidatus Mesenet longicola]
MLLSSVAGGGIEQFLDMEIEEFILWFKVAREIKCQYFQ